MISKLYKNGKIPGNINVSGLNTLRRNMQKLLCSSREKNYKIMAMKRLKFFEHEINRQIIEQLRRKKRLSRKHKILFTLGKKKKCVFEIKKKITVFGKTVPKGGLKIILK